MQGLHIEGILGFLHVVNDSQGHRTPMFLTIVCFLTSCIGQLLATIGYLCWKRASVVEGDKALILRWYFWIGFALIGINAIPIGMFVYAYTPMTLTAPCQALSIVFGNILASKGILVEKEYVGKMSILATVITIVGVVLSGISGPSERHAPTEAMMKFHFGQPTTLAYFFASAGIVLSFLLFSKELPPSSNVKVFWGILVAALCGSVGNVGLKTVSVCFRVAHDAGDSFEPVATYTAAGGGALLSILNVYFLNKAIENSSSTYNIPLYIGLDVILTAVTGALAYGDLDHLKGDQASMMAAGMSITVFGLLALVQGQKIDNAEVAMKEETTKSA